MTRPAGSYKEYIYNFLTQSQVDTIDANLAMPAGQAISQIFDTANVVQYANVTVTTAQLLALCATPVTILPAPGSGYAIQFLAALLYLPYNSIAYTIANPTDYLNFRYANASGAIVSDNVNPTGFLDQKANTFTTARGKANQQVAASVAVNAPIVLHNSGAAEWTAGNSPIQVRVSYTVHAI